MAMWTRVLIPVKCAYLNFQRQYKGINRADGLKVSFSIQLAQTHNISPKCAPIMPFKNVN